MIIVIENRRIAIQSCMFSVCLDQDIHFFPEDKYVFGTKYDRGPTHTHTHTHTDTYTHTHTHTHVDTHTHTQSRIAELRELRPVHRVARFRYVRRGHDIITRHHHMTSSHDTVTRHHHHSLSRLPRLLFRATRSVVQFVFS
eukprot:GHVU01122257.1.p1 GENE.GHVU01122257.1~~GHVU01122257.1.p1  ORF type:complete len:141 (-),score=8.28 GHVU01122257.1:1015-1437(-)